MAADHCRVFRRYLFRTRRKAQRIKVAVIDEDSTTGSREFLLRLEKSKEFDAVAAGRREALQSVRQGKQVTAILIPRGFGEASSRMFYGPPAKVEVLIDPSRKAESAMLQGLLFKIASEGTQKQLLDRNLSRTTVQKALKDVAANPDAKVKQEVGRFLGELDRFLQASAAAVPAAKEIASWHPLQEPKNGGKRIYHRTDLLVNSSMAYLAHG
jgi:ABC-2 type transport system permease protein